MKRPTTAFDACGLLFLALVLMFVRIGAKSIWLDEAVAVEYAHMSLRELFSVVTTQDPNMSLYYVLLNLWVRIAGEGETAVRALSALFAALAVATIYLLGHRLFGRRAGLVAGLLLMLNAFFVEHAQSARGYALTALLILLSCYFFVVEVEQPSPRVRIAWALTSALAVYAHYLAALALMVQLLALLTMKRRAALTPEWLRAGTTLVLLCTPAAYVASHSEGAARIAWLHRPSLGDLASALKDLAGDSIFLLLALLTAGCWGTVLAMREGRSWTHGFVAAWLVIPVATSFAASFVKPMFLSRYFIFCVPALVLFGAAGIVKLRPTALAAATLSLLVWIAATKLVAFYGREGYYGDWRSAAAYVLDATREGDAIAFFPYWDEAPFHYYDRRMKRTPPLTLRLNEPDMKPRIWAVSGKFGARLGRPEDGQVRTFLEEHYQPAERREFGGIEVELHVLKRSPGVS